MVALLMTQLLPAGNSTLHNRFRNMVYQAIVQSNVRLPVPPATPLPWAAPKP
jgi:hypothetical protein